MSSKQKKRKNWNTWYKLIATCFGVGKLPMMPGTFGSLAAYPIYHIMVASSFKISEAQHSLYFIIVLLCFLALLAITNFHTDVGVIDHRSIVIDELIGQLLTMALSFRSLKNITLHYMPSIREENVLIFVCFIIGLIFFRIFDISKPFFISYIDRYMKNAVGVILDDVVAAIYASCVIYCIGALCC